MDYFARSGTGDDHAEDHQADRRDLVFSQGLFHMMEETSVIAHGNFLIFPFDL